jgi:hypothetical protein
MNPTDRPASVKPQPIDGLLPWLVSISATPGVAGAIAARSCLRWLEDAGIASEEIFRGNRLPVLPFPSENAPANLEGDEIAVAGDLID